MKFICKECKTRYTNNVNDETPTGIEWSDGHICRPEPEEDKDKKL